MNTGDLVSDETQALHLPTGDRAMGARNRLEAAGWSSLLEPGGLSGYREHSGRGYRLGPERPGEASQHQGQSMSPCEVQESRENVPPLACAQSQSTGGGQHPYSCEHV